MYVYGDRKKNVKSGKYSELTQNWGVDGSRRHGIGNNGEIYGISQHDSQAISNLLSGIYRHIEGKTAKKRQKDHWDNGVEHDKLGSSSEGEEYVTHDIATCIAVLFCDGSIKRYILPFSTFSVEFVQDSLSVELHVNLTPGVWPRAQSNGACLSIKRIICYVTWAVGFQDKRLCPPYFSRVLYPHQVGFVINYACAAHPNNGRK